jgi:hypothetical protein
MPKMTTDKEDVTVSLDKRNLFFAKAQLASNGSTLSNLIDKLLDQWVKESLKKMKETGFHDILIIGCKEGTEHLPDVERMYENRDMVVDAVNVGQDYRDIDFKFGHMEVIDLE